MSSYYLKMFKTNWWHNNSKAHLRVPVNSKSFDHFVIKVGPLIILSSLGIIYSISGFVFEVFPEQKVFQEDRRILLTKKRCFDTLIMAHKQLHVKDKCNMKSLF